MDCIAHGVTNSWTTTEWLSLQWGESLDILDVRCYYLSATVYEAIRNGSIKSKEQFGWKRNPGNHHAFIQQIFIGHLTHRVTDHFGLLRIIPVWGAFLVAQMVKNLPAVQETWVQCLGWEDPPEEGMATNSSILAWRIPWTEEPGGLWFMELQRVRHNWVTKHSTSQLEQWTSLEPPYSQGRQEGWWY